MTQRHESWGQRMRRLEDEVRRDVAGSDAKTQTAYEYVAKAQWALSQLAASLMDLAELPDEEGVGEGDRRMWRASAAHAMARAQVLSSMWGPGREITDDD